MNRLIKFLCLMTVSGFNFSLYSSKESPAGDHKFELYRQTHFLTATLFGIPAKFHDNGKLVKAKDDRVFVYSDAAKSKLERGELENVPFEELQRDGYVQEVLVDIEAYRLMQKQLPLYYKGCNNIFSKFEFKQLANNVICAVSDKEKLKRLARKILSMTEAPFPEKYGTALFRVICMHVCWGEGGLSGSFEVNPSKESGVVGVELWNLVRKVICVWLRVYSETDNLTCLAKFFNLKRVKKEEFDKLVKSEIDDGFVVASNIVAANYLLREVLDQLNSIK